MLQPIDSDKKAVDMFPRMGIHINVNMEFGDIERIKSALPFEKQSNMDDWLITEKIEDVVVGTSIPYNYEK